MNDAFKQHGAFSWSELLAEVSRFPYATMRNKAPINDFCVGLPR